MKHLVPLFFIFFALLGQAQTIPAVTLKDTSGKTVNTAALVGQGSPVIISFWATWCSPCKRELNNYAEYFEDWQEEFGVSLIAVSIDDQRTANRVAPYINSVEWPYMVLLDPNRDFARNMQVTNVPHTFIVDADGKVVWQNNNYSDGDEDEVYEILKHL
jgi:peroxiredoxin